MNEVHILAGATTLLFVSAIVYLVCADLAIRRKCKKGIHYSRCRDTRGFWFCSYCGEKEGN